MSKEQTYKKIEEYYKKHRERLVKSVYGRAGSVANAEDIVQDAFVRALTYHDSYVPGIYDFGAWFHRILDNTASDFSAVERLRGATVELDEDMIGEDTQDHYFKRLYKEVIELINAEKRKDVRHILHLYFIEQYKPADITKVMPLSNGAIRAVIHRFRVEVKDKFGEDLCS